MKIPCKLGIILLQLKTLGAGLEETTKRVTAVSQYCWIVQKEINTLKTVF